MNDTHYKVLSFMRDIAVPEQEFVTVGFVNDNIDEKIRESHLDALEAKGFIKEIENDVESTGYYVTSEGIQAVTIEDLNKTLATTNQELSDLAEQMEGFEKSQTQSSAVQTIFSVTIISFTTYQILLNFSTETGGVFTIEGLVVGIVGTLLSLAALAFGLEPLRNAFKQS